MKRFGRKLALVMVVCMVIGLFAGCGKASDKTLVVGYDNFSSKFSPFFATTAYDVDVADMVSQYLFITDREGNVVQKGIDGETIAYNGTDYEYKAIADMDVVVNDNGSVEYDIKMRDDIKFSDGHKMTIDDVIFTLYVECDPTYDGTSTFYALPVTGMAEYRSGMDTLFNLLVAAGPDNTDFANWDEATQKAFWTDFYGAGAKFVQEIIDFCIANGYNAEGDSPATCIANWGFEAPADATTEDIFKIMLEAYGNDAAALSETESAGSALTDLMENYGAYAKGVSTGSSADNIAGIVKTGDYSMKVLMDSFDANAIYQLSFPVAPLHYYGDEKAYNYDNNQFGFTKGDLSSVREKTTKPMGAGAYKFVSYENGVVTFEANSNYFKGKPKTKFIQFKETPATDKLTGLASGTFDISDPAMSAETLKAIKEYNSNGEINGDKLETYLVDNLGYGYLGISANNVKVGTAKDSEESKSLRKAFATLFACYRDTVINSYYGEMATVIQYPISNTSWAAPRPADDGYRLAYSVDADGNNIYTADMTDEQKADAALQAAISFFKAAGYKFDDASGKFTEAPEGARMTYEVIVPADGVGDHPAFGILTAAKEALASIGITLEINDPSDSNVLWDKLDADTQDMWAAAWQATADPDMYQVYHSDNYLSGTTSNHYGITSAELDELIIAARSSADQAYRKSTYKQCLEILLDWGVEIPAYQRQNAFVMSPERVDLSTVTPDITTFWTWLHDLEKLEMK